MFKVGDKIRVIATKATNNTDQHPLSVGDIGEVIRIGSYQNGLVINWISTKNKVSPNINSMCGWPNDIFELVEEKKMEYKVGKKYIEKSFKNRVYTCVWINKNGIALFEKDTGLSVVLAYPTDTIWEEVKEKIVVTKYVHWFRKIQDDNQIFSFISSNQTPDFDSLLMKEKYIKTDTITYEVEKL